MNINNNEFVNSCVLVIFSDKNDLWFLNWLSRGYRHCFALIEQPEGWILYDPLSNRSVIRYYEDRTKEQLIFWYSVNGYKVVETEIAGRVPHRLAPILPYTCVEAMKRLLGIHRWFLLTPRQLFAYLKNKT